MNGNRLYRDPNYWQTGDVITENKMNNFEDALFAVADEIVTAAGRNNYNEEITLNERLSLINERINGVLANVVYFDRTQSLTDAQMIRARDNIGAASMAGVNELTKNLNLNNNDRIYINELSKSLNKVVSESMTGAVAGGYYDKDGSLVEHSQHNYKFIAYLGGRVTTESAKRGDCHVAFFDKDMAVIPNSGYNWTLPAEFLSIPDATVAICVSCRKENNSDTIVTQTIPVYTKYQLIDNQLVSNNVFDLLYRYTIKKDGVSDTINGVTFAFQDGVCTLNGTSTGAIVERLYYDVHALPNGMAAGKRYRVEIQSSKCTDIRFRVAQYHDGTEIPNTGSITSYGSFDLTVDSSADGMQISIYVPSGVTLANDTYQVSVFEIDAISGERLSHKIDDFAAVQLPTNWFDYGNTVSGRYQYANFVEDGGFISCKNFIPCKPGQYVVASHEWLVNGNGRRSSSGLLRAYIYYDANKQYLSQPSGTNVVPNGAAYVRISVNKALTTGDNSQFMVEVKDENTFGNYSPYFAPYYAVNSLAEIQSEIEASKKKAELERWIGMSTGLFIHWGVYSVLEGVYSGENTDGEQVTYDNGSDWTYGAEWILKTVKIPKATYKGYTEQFTSTGFDAEAIAKMAYEAGMKYVVITAKHHEGFYLFPTQYGDWTIDASPARNTVLDELKKACEKYGLKFCLYFSQFRDWTQEGGFDQKYITGSDPYTIEQHSAYIQNTINALDEMMARYEPYVLWWDGDKVASLYTDPVYNWLMKKYPNVITNDRLGFYQYEGDYATGEGAYYSGDREYAENCYTLNGTWGYSTGKDLRYTTTIDVLLKSRILESLSNGQNALINIGPKKDGSVPQNQINILGDIADLVKKHGLFENRKRICVDCKPLWGRMFAIGRVLKCYVYEGETIKIEGVNTRFVKAVRVYGASDEYSAANYSVTSDNTMIVSNLVYETPYKMAFVDVEFSNDIVTDDVNYIVGNEKITVLAFNIFGVMTLRQQSSTNRNYLQWSNSSYLETQFVFDGETGSYYMNNEWIDAKESGVDYTLSATVTELDTGTAMSVSMTNDNRSTGTVAFTNGKKYRLKLNKSGGWFDLRAVWFEQ